MTTDIHLPKLTTCILIFLLSACSQVNVVKTKQNTTTHLPATTPSLLDSVVLKKQQPTCNDLYQTKKYSPITGKDFRSAATIAKPEKGTAFIDPTYGNCIIRLTDTKLEPTAGYARNDYSRRQAFNADKSKVLISARDGYWHLYDGNSFAYIKKLTGPAGDAEIQWHPKDPDRLYYTPNNGGMKIYEYNIQTDEHEIAGDFNNRLIWPDAARVWTRSEGSPSSDGRYWGFLVETSHFEPLGLITWDLKSDTIIASWDFSTHGASRPDHVSMSPSGEYMVSSWRSTSLGTIAFTADFSSQIKLHHTSEHSDIALLPNGHDAYISVDYGSNSGDVFMIELQTGIKTVLFPTYINGTSTAYHFSGKAFDNPGWVLVSTYNSPGNAVWSHEKIFAVELAANPTIYNLAHHRAAYSKYHTAPVASVSRDFTRILFNSTWGTRNGIVDAYMIKLPKDVLRNDN